tara:strand:+ start:1773 stop:1976 length:204 start_codon:yes stop_codon:yes gene_type:complete
MRIDVEKLLSEGWYIYSLGNEDMLAPPQNSKFFHRAAEIQQTRYKGKVIHFFYYKGFPWNDYIKDKK